MIGHWAMLEGAATLGGRFMLGAGLHWRGGAMLGNRSWGDGSPPVHSGRLVSLRRRGGTSRLKHTRNGSDDIISDDVISPSSTS